MEQRPPLFWGVFDAIRYQHVSSLTPQECWNFELYIVSLFFMKANHFPGAAEPPQETSKQATGFQRLKTLKLPHWWIYNSYGNKIKSLLIVITCVSLKNGKLSAPVNFIFSQASRKNCNGIMGKLTLQYYSHPSCSCFQTTESTPGWAEIANIKEVLMNSWHEEYIL